MAGFRLFALPRFASRKATESGAPVLASRRVAELTARAKLAAELAERAWKPVDPWRHGSGVATANDLYRQSIHWTLLALREPGNAPGSVATESVVSAEPPPSFTTLWDSADQALLEHAAGGSSRLATLRADLADRSYLELAEQDSGKQADLVQRLAAFSRTLFESLEPAVRRLERMWVRRVAWSACALAALGVLVVAGLKLRDWRDSRRNLAANASWVASSNYGVGGCRSPHQSCVASPNYFFHTHMQEDPSVIFDLGSAKRISAVVVWNRKDCCQERTVPLAVDVSTDKKTWQEVARSTSSFEVWRADFPRVRARWVRLHVPQMGVLHLSSVRVLP